jgi:DnaJ-like protein
MTMTPEDPYEVLQVSPRASAEVIRAAYRVLARSYHPDVSTSPAAAMRMQELNAAYKALIDPERRAQLDAQRPVERARVAASRRLSSPPCRAPVEVQPFAVRPRRARPLVLALGLSVVLMLLFVFFLAVSFAIDALDAPVTSDQIGQVVTFAGTL